MGMLASDVRALSPGGEPLDEPLKTLTVCSLTDKQKKGTTTRFAQTGGTLFLSANFQTEEFSQSAKMFSPRRQSPHCLPASAQEVKPSLFTDKFREVESPV